MSRRGKSAGRSLLLVDEPGTSVDKSVYQLSSGLVGTIATEPHLKELSLNEFNPPRFKPSLPPERQSWVKCGVRCLQLAPMLVPLKLGGSQSSQGRSHDS
jgi:hypothetical protein